jgi:hypothetical protein
VLFRVEDGVLRTLEHIDLLPLLHGISSPYCQRRDPTEHIPQTAATPPHHYHRQNDGRKDPQSPAQLMLALLVDGQTTDKTRDVLRTSLLRSSDGEAVWGSAQI